MRENNQLYVKAKPLRTEKQGKKREGERKRVANSLGPYVQFQ